MKDDTQTDRQGTEGSTHYIYTQGNEEMADRQVTQLRLIRQDETERTCQYPIRTGNPIGATHVQKATTSTRSI